MLLEYCTANKNDRSIRHATKCSLADDGYSYKSTPLCGHIDSNST